MGIFDESYSSVDLARILGVHRVTVTKWIKKGALKAVRTPGGRYKVTRKDLRDFLEERGMTIPPFLRTKEKKLVVAVDDDESSLNMLRTLFSTEDMPYLYRLETFTNPLDAAIFIGDQKPDLVLLNLLMLDLHGLNLADKIKQISPSTRIIVLTGGSSCEKVPNTKGYDIDAMMRKPLDIEKLKMTIEDILMTR